MIEIIASLASFQTLGFVGIVMAVFVPLGIKFEHRLTKVEVKIDALLDHNGIDPKDCVKKKSKK